ncbi:glycosyltransferase family 2 protein [Microbulbifer elongatus]|uniref:glycosyltransferase family 2 protein n=1 Tax=Microbulbifer elongatus TaxID=86173 RepID=UPI001E46D691|nr:glycosyltransferase [Microbulbifer elongatus]
MKYSIIVPIYEQWHLVPDLIDCLERQSTCAETFEVVLVDNGSTIFCPPDRVSNRFRIIKCKRPGSYAARNYGVRHSKGEWLVFTDADCLPEPDWLSEINQKVAQLNGQTFVIAGNIKMLPSSSSPCAYEIYDLVKGVPQSKYVKQGYAATANLAFSRSLFDMVGGFDECRYSGGDAEFCRRAVHNKATLIFAEDAVVGHRARRSWFDIASKARRIKGSQLRRGSFTARFLTIGRTFLPPLFAVVRFLRLRDFSMNSRAIAIMVQFRIWTVEIYEVIRLLLRAEAERR